MVIHAVSDATNRLLIMYRMNSGFPNRPLKENKLKLFGKILKSMVRRSVKELSDETINQQIGKKNAVARTPSRMNTLTLLMVLRLISITAPPFSFLW
jgi:hypothetical protein